MHSLFVSHTPFIFTAPPPNQPIPRSLEKSNFPGPKSQDLVRFRKEIEQNNVQKVYELICLNPRYLVSSGDTPSILKEGPRYNALHVAAMNKHARMAKLILQTVEQTQFIEHLHGFKNDPNIEVMCHNLLDSYLNTPDKSRNETPLHFAAKVGAVDVIEVLISYPICKMKKNADGLYPKDVT
jgi:ankyrin repeat protein